MGDGKRHYAGIFTFRHSEFAEVSDVFLESSEQIDIWGTFRMAASLLQALDFIGSNDEPAPGLTPVPYDGSKGPALSIDEQAALFDAHSFKLIDFVFFRRFSDGRSSQIAAYIVDNSEEKLDERTLSELHLKVWLHGTVPLLYISSPTRIDVLSCARAPDFWQNERCEYKPAITIRDAAQITEEMQRFSAFRLADGTFWEDPQTRGLFDYRKAAHQSLIESVVETDKEIDGANNPVLRRLLLVMILVKYLEDRRVFPDPSWFGRFRAGARSFFDVLSGGEPDETNRLLDFLEHKFNGDIFTLSSDGRKELTKKKLRRFADLVEGKTLKRQRYLWEQYSFEHLPVEILSHLYQRFVQGGQGAVYTPHLLSSLLLDHTMPYESLHGNERILDPACGSGIFLVGAFRRLVNIWRSKNKWKKPNVETLKGILARSIFGVELDSFAVDLTAFSLSLAVCDALKPEVIWNELKFDRLRESNLSQADFFAEVLSVQAGRKSILGKRFDIIIGNPPFKSRLTDAGDRVDKTEQAQADGRGKLPDRQAAYLFLEQALKSLRSGGKACLIQPSSFLYNRKSAAFRKTIFCTYQVETLFDFSSIRKLYEADTKTIAILIRKGEPTPEHKIPHWTFRRTKSVHERICFELDHYDRHHVPQELAESNPYVWRANLLGGGRLLEISQRLGSMRTLKDYVEENGWEYGEGIIVGKGGSRAPFLTGKPHLPTTALTKSGIDEEKIYSLSETHFECPRREAIFRGPLILVKELESLPVAFWEDGFLSYRHEIVGIKAPASAIAKLRHLYEFLCERNDVLRFVLSLYSSRLFLAKSTAVLKGDIDLLPFPEDFRSLDLSFWEQAMMSDVLEYFASYIKLGQNSQLLQEAADAKDLRKYSDLFIRLLGSVYDELHASEPIFLQGLTCQPFYFGDRPDDFSWISKMTENDLNKLIYDDNNYKTLRTTRIIRYYNENVILLVKPDRLRYWIRSTAIRDADETLVDFRRQGL